MDAPGCHFREVSPRKSHSLGGFWALTFVTFRCFCSSCFCLAFLNCSFGDFAATRVTKVAKKGAKMEPKAFPERLRDMCQKHAIYCTGSTSAPPGSVLKPDVSSNPFREAPGSPLEAHLCDSSTVLAPPLASILCSWSLRFSVHFLDAFLKRPLTSSTGEGPASGVAGWGGGFLFRRSLERTETALEIEDARRPAFGLARRIPKASPLPPAPPATS